MNDVADDEYGAVDEGVQVVVAEEVESAGSRASFGGGKVGAITVLVVAHGRGVVADDGVGMGGCAVEQLDASVGGVLGSLGLGRADVIQGDQHGAVDGSGVEQEDAHCFVWAFDS